MQHNYKAKRNATIVRLHDVDHRSLRAISRKYGLTNSVVHKVYWGEKIRATRSKTHVMVNGKRKAIPKGIQKIYAHLLK